MVSDEGIPPCTTLDRSSTLDAWSFVDGGTGDRSQRRKTRASVLGEVDREEASVAMAELQQGSLSWKKSTASGGGACVEVARVGETIIVRDSKNVLGPVLTFSGEEWRDFLVGARSGQFNT